MILMRTQQSYHSVFISVILRNAGYSNVNAYCKAQVTPLTKIMMRQVDEAVILRTKLSKSDGLHELSEDLNREIMFHGVYLR